MAAMSTRVGSFVERSFGLVVAAGGIGLGVTSGALRFAQGHALQPPDSDVGTPQRMRVTRRTKPPPGPALRRLRMPIAPGGSRSIW